MKIHAIVNFEALDAQRTIVKAYLSEDQADKALEVMQSGEDDSEPYIYAGEVISFDVEPSHPPVSKESLQGETVEPVIPNDNHDINYISQNGLQPFEAFPDLADCLLHAASFWKVDDRWSETLSRINDVAIMLLQEREFRQSQHTATALAEAKQTIADRDSLIKTMVSVGVEINEALAESQARVKELEAELTTYKTMTNSLVRGR